MGQPANCSGSRRTQIADVQRAEIFGPFARIALAPASDYRYELSRQPDSRGWTEAFMDETGNLRNYLQRIAAFGVAVSEGTVKAGFAAAMGVLVLSWGTMQITEASAESAG